MWVSKKRFERLVKFMGRLESRVDELERGSMLPVSTHDVGETWFFCENTSVPVKDAVTAILSHLGVTLHLRSAVRIVELREADGQKDKESSTGGGRCHL